MRDPGTMARAFLSALPAGVERPDEPGLGAALAALHDGGRSAWPDIALDPVLFARHLGALADPRALLPREAFAADVYLACAAAHGDARAVAAFERLHAAAIARAVARVGGALGDDAAQLVRERLLVPSAGGPPRIAAYAGRAPLGGWVNTVAVRTALNLRRDDRPERARPLEGAALAASDDPEIDLLKVRYRVELEEAVKNAVARLTTRERTLLRLHLEQGLTVDALGAHYGVPRATAGRWLKAAREALAAHTRADLLERLGLTPSELESVVRLVKSQVEVSVIRLLREENRPPE